MSNKITDHEKELFELAHNISVITTQHIKNYSDPGSWIHYYSKNFQVKIPQINFTENLEAFTVKIRKIFDFIQLSYWTVKVTNEKTYNAKDHDWFIKLEEKIFLGLALVDEKDFETIIRPILKTATFGRN